MLADVDLHGSWGHDQPHVQPMGVNDVNAQPATHGGRLDPYLKRICEDAGATSARIILMNAQNHWLEHVASPGRDLRQDEVLVEILTTSDMAPVTVNASREGTMVECAEVAGDCKVVLIASYERRGPRAAGYVRHEIRRKLGQLLRDLARTPLDAQQSSGR
jgi:hypothetical protein